MGNSQALLDFLLFSYFGYENMECAQKDKKKCAKRAYLDLARTVKYIYSSSELEKAKKNSKEEVFKKKRDELIDNICTELIKNIENYPNKNDRFDEWHKNECKWIINEMNQKNADEGRLFVKTLFTYGQAQKWVNMTLKYLWLLDLLPDRILPEDLHVPVDSFILQKLKGTGKFDEKDNEITNSGEMYYYNGYTWSAIPDYESYNKLQDKIREIAKENGIFPIEWEGDAWIEISVERSNSKKK